MKATGSTLLGRDDLEALNNSLSALESRRAATVQRINALEPQRREVAVEAAGGDIGAQSELESANATLDAEQKALRDLDLAIDGLRGRILEAERRKTAELRAEKIQSLKNRIQERAAAVSEIETSMRALAPALRKASELAEEIRTMRHQLLDPAASQAVEDPLQPMYVRVRLVEFAARLGFAWWFDSERLAGSQWVSLDTFIKSETQAHAAYDLGR